MENQSSLNGHHSGHKKQPKLNLKTQMDITEFLRELELVAWEHAEAEAYEKRAASLRANALKRIGLIHCNMKDWEAAVKEAKAAKPKQTKAA